VLTGSLIGLAGWALSCCAGGETQDKNKAGPPLREG
jgi:hypothetical protein